MIWLGIQISILHPLYFNSSNIFWFMAWFLFKLHVILRSTFHFRKPKLHWLYWTNRNSESKVWVCLYTTPLTYIILTIQTFAICFVDIHRYVVLCLHFNQEMSPSSANQWTFFFCNDVYIFCISYLSNNYIPWGKAIL